MKWGILGHGLIAPQFINSLEAIPTQEIYAIASRSNHEALAATFPAKKIYDKYEALCRDPSVEVIYVSTPHNFHCAHVLLALSHGKHVICEKPMGISAKEVREMQKMAKQTHRFLMEGMWTRFLPAYQQALQHLHEGAIGDIRWLQADFSFSAPYEPKKRWLNPALAGGSVYDVGVYPLALALDVFREIPSHIHAHAQMTETGVDGNCAVSLHFPGGGSAQLFSGVNVDTPHLAQIGGQDGSMQIPSFWKASSFTILKENDTRTVSRPYVRTGYYHEIIAAIHSIEAGLIECPTYPFEQSLKVAEIVDEVLLQINYPDVSRS
ncbi:MAG: Gfo/Idh/MocA family oxidoreductase [Bacteroidota bacterium]